MWDTRPLPWSRSGETSLEEAACEDQGAWDCLQHAWRESLALVTLCPWGWSVLHCRRPFLPLFLSFPTFLLQSTPHFLPTLCMSPMFTTVVCPWPKYLLESLKRWEDLSWLVGSEGSQGKGTICKWSNPLLKFHALICNYLRSTFVLDRREGLILFTILWVCKWLIVMDWKQPFSLLPAASNE